MEEMRKRCREEKGRIGMEEKKKEFFAKKRLEVEEVERIKESGEDCYRDVEWKDREERGKEVKDGEGRRGMGGRGGKRIGMGEVRARVCV